MTLPAGQTLNAALTAPFVAAGLAAGAVRFAGTRLGPFAYVIPHPAPDAAHVAYFSPARAPSGISTIVDAVATIGAKDGAPFIHCHAIWREADGALRGGHILPHETCIAHEGSAQGWGLGTVRIVAEPDAETNFPLFHPRPHAGQEFNGPRLVAARVKPNQEIHHAIEEICAAHGASRAILRGSVGSLHAPRFADGHQLEDTATEVFATNGIVSPDTTGRPRARLDMAVVDMRGDVHQGELARGANGVCVTFELVLEIGQ